MNDDKSSLLTSADSHTTLSSLARQVCVSRQPIYDPHLRVFAYALACHSPEANLNEDTDVYPTSSELIYATLMEAGLDRIVGQKQALFRLTQDSLLLDHAHIFPPKKVILEVSDITPIDTALIEAVMDLSAQGYTIALNDMIDFDYSRPLLEATHLIRIDLSACPRPRVRERVDHLRQCGVKLLAGNVETQEEFSYCKELGFDYFQGFFFCQPETVMHHRSPTNRIAIMQLMTALLHPETEFDELEDIVSRDVSLSYKVLRLINSSFFGLQNKINSIRQALLLLGVKSLTTWVSLILLSGIEDKPQELTTTAMVRAKMCELLAQEMSYNYRETFFLVGLFSVLDALMDMPMTEIVASLPLDDMIVQALLHHEGALGLTLRSVLAYERGNWDDVFHLGVDRSAMTDIYLQAIVWADAHNEIL